MNQKEEKEKALRTLLAVLKSWDGHSVKQAEEVLQQARQLISENTGISVTENDTELQQLTAQVVAQYGELTVNLQKQKNAVAQQIQKLNRPSSIVSAYLQQDKGAALIDVDF
ncbi:hypothetical protein [Liquorilactobacillus oeni]|nr:hypothetical protein [Liquorilactobacillus oeni]AJA34170.1 hypothetical protein [Liquorilactobacillus oeni]